MRQRSQDRTLKWMAKPITGASCRSNSQARAVLRMVAQQVDMSPVELICVGCDVKLYPNNIRMARELLRCEPRPFPKLNLRRRRGNIDEYRIEDFEVTECDLKSAIAALVVA
ncbi:MAG: thymidylate synthase [Brucella intermedia]